MVTAREFYTKLTPKGLANTYSEEATDKEIKTLKKIIPIQNKVLDVCCGYGRITIPLAQAGYIIEGVDITPSFIKSAIVKTKRSRLNVNFKVGDMRELPYDSDSFDTVICMWSAFMELPRAIEQKKAIAEMYRVLRKGGFALIDVRYFKGSEYKDVKMNNNLIKSHIRKDNVMVNIMVGKLRMNNSYRHDKNTLTNLVKSLKIKNYKVSTPIFGGRKRLFLMFWK